ncbi:MAG: efflux RND transporter permease subunit, partial [Spirochaetales bacterium]|nr:efflux RND transporter permease subunit [Spirochaetales bacterium]
ASLVKTTGPVSINRENQSRLVHVTARVKSGVPENVAETMVQTLVNEKLVLREGVIIRYEGNWRETQEMIVKFVAIVIIAIALVFGVMASQFESLKDPFIILASIPFLAIGIVGIYLIAGRPFSMLTAVGVIMLVGIVVNNGIVLVDYTNLLVQRGLTVTQACIEAGGNRLRPILMTSLTTIFGMLPMALTTGEEAAMIQDIGFTVLGGMISSTLITLFFVPALYAAFNKEKRRRSRYSRLEQSLTLPVGETLPDSVH